MADQQPDHIWRVALCASSSRPHDQIPWLATGEREIQTMGQHESFIRWLSPRSDELSRLQAAGGQGVAIGDEEENDLVRVIQLLDKIVSGETVTSSDRMFDRSVRPRKMTIKDAQATAAPCATILRKVLAAMQARPPAALVPDKEAPPPRKWITEDRSYELRSSQIIAFNTCKGDLDDKLDAAHKALFGINGLTVGGDGGAKG